ncbi:MAG: hypothetical protein P4L22_04090 [Candidatus Babeliales bacterium]|nr:hypothetical protein [Candidatus Babeliales bacterium]
MLYKKILLLILIFALSTNTFIKCDFFAFRKLTNPETGQIVYLLYDIHASKGSQHTKPLQKQIINDLNQFIIEAGIQNKIPESNPQVIEIAKSFYNNFPNLIKQQKDLLTIAEKYKVSFIVEDWPPLDYSEDRVVEGELNKYFYWRYFGGDNFTINTNNYYTTHITPMLEIGNKLTGKSTICEFVPLDSGAYFFNPDQRTRGGLSAGIDANEILENHTINAVEELFIKYKQKAVIIAEGYVHIGIIAKQLISQGYQIEPLIISPALQDKRKDLPHLDIMLKDCENLVDSHQRLTSTQNKELTYSLIEEPLNIEMILTAELQKDGIKQVGQDSINISSKPSSFSSISSSSSSYSKKPDIIKQRSTKTHLKRRSSRSSSSYSDLIEHSLINDPSKPRSFSSSSYSKKPSLPPSVPYNIYIKSILGLFAASLFYKASLTKIAKQDPRLKNTATILACVSTIYSFYNALIKD